jgi:hypothetical protein
MERDRGYRIFEVLARMASDEQPGSREITKLLDIKALPYEWDDTPYIFYELFEPDRPDVRRIVAVRGNQFKEGIADGYSKVDPRSARSIVRAVMSGAPLDVSEGVPVETVEYGDAPHLKAVNDAIERRGTIH